jgi:sulfate adenylyltransferase subunit 1 (EFTu-like GTPase family)
MYAGSQSGSISNGAQLYVEDDAGASAVAAVFKVRNETFAAGVIPTVTMGTADENPGHIGQIVIRTDTHEIRFYTGSPGAGGSGWETIGSW